MAGIKALCTGFSQFPQGGKIRARFIPAGMTVADGHQTAQTDTGQSGV